MRLLLQHASRYAYPTPAHLGAHTLRLRPAAHTRARVEAYRLKITQDHHLRWQQDPYGNHVARVHFPADRGLDALDVLVELVVDVNPVNPFDFLVEEYAENAPFKYPPELARELRPFLGLDDPALARGPLFDAFDAELPTSGPTVTLVTELNRAVNARVRYVIREEIGVYTPEQCLTAGHASCRDSAVLLMTLLRRRGFPARFVSGYLIQLVDEGMLPDQPKGVSRDVVDLHAWCEVYLPGAGWVGLDATSGLLCGEGHIPLCGASTPALASPLEGTSDTGASEVSFSMVIGRLGHEIRPTTPYTDPVWDALQAAGDAVDAHLRAHGVHLTMGGEPTFNARDRTELPEWNGAALGAHKHELALKLVAELERRLAPGAAVLHKQGKWYPGESLPRWAIEVIGRKDGAPIWPERAKLARGDAPDGASRDLAEALAAELGVQVGLHAAYEDPWETIQAESRAPVGVDLTKADLDDPEERRRLARVLTRGVGAVVAYVLPLTPAADGGWLTDRWQLRRGELYLLPGDSPAGLRLPLASLGAGIAPPPVAEPAVVPPDPRRGGDDDAQAHFVAPSTAAGRVLTGVRTALTVEVRDGHVYAFLPPLPSFDRFVDLVAALDRARARVGRDVRLEGYGPPSSPDAARFSVTPDPGVIEVNVPPTASMRDYDALVGHVFDAALHSDLHAEKYLVDGRMAGSGGGNHITLGGRSALESPFIKRPDLLASLLTFLQHHPSLSYLFSGLFVGP
ncbi:MAG: transglutaminase family protein, partial [Myxococcales bacterium]|nr:transglutaminase family protein [Myxococcales bacterium]